MVKVRFDKTVMLRLLGVAALFIFWQVSQMVLEHLKIGTATSVGTNNQVFDLSHYLLSSQNTYLNHNPGIANGLLITSSFVYDVLLSVFVFLCVFGRSFRPFMGVFIIVILRQIAQAFTCLPYPEGMIWRYPGFPSINITYDVGTDFFFSGHIAVLAYCSLQFIFHKEWSSRAISILLVIIGVFEVLTALMLRAHYFMDIYASLITGFFVHYFLTHKNKVSLS